MFDIDEDKYELFEINGYTVTDQFKGMGFDVTLSLLLLGSIGFFFTLYLIKIVALVAVYTVYKLQGSKNTFKGYKIYKNLLKAVFFNDLIAICRESFIEILIVGYFTA